MTTPNASQRREPTHDSGYKLLYSHAAMVRDLQCGFVSGVWVQALDLETLARDPGALQRQLCHRRPAAPLRRPHLASALGRGVALRLPAAGIPIQRRSLDG